MFFQPIDRRLEDARQVLIAGAGGGYDVVCGLPLLFALEARGCEVHLANLTFTDLHAVTEALRPMPDLVRVTADSRCAGYFPEGWLARWFREHLGREVPVWCFRASGVVPYRECYEYLVKHLDVDTILVVDGGVDTLLRGDEFSLGTPLWDALTIAAVDGATGPQKILVSIGFGAERWDKISHAQVLERIADLTRQGAFLGVTSLLRGTTEGDLFRNAVRYLFDHQLGVRQSTVACCLLAAMKGLYGERAVNAYTEMTPLWISPLMCLYWYFDLPEVARQKLYLPSLIPTTTLEEAAAVLQQFTAGLPKRVAEAIPI